MIDYQIFNEQQQANEISSDSSNSTQWCPIISNKVQKTNESTMDIKHGSSCALKLFYFLYFIFF
jgi:hypothetical protein